MVSFVLVDSPKASVSTNNIQHARNSQVYHRCHSCPNQTRHIKHIKHTSKRLPTQTGPCVESSLSPILIPFIRHLSQFNLLREFLVEHDKVAQNAVASEIESFSGRKRAIGFDAQFNFRDVRVRDLVQLATRWASLD